jgi:hypothetical protein
MFSGMLMRLLLLTSLAAACLAVSDPGRAAVPTPSRCAAIAPATRAVSGARAPLVPAGARSLRLCRYRGLNPPATARRLVAMRFVVERLQVESIAAALDALPVPTGVIRCPMDDGSEIVATFAYAHGSSIAIRIGLRGCETVTGPHPPVRTAAHPAGQRLIAQLERLVP